MTTTLAQSANRLGRRILEGTMYGNLVHGHDDQATGAQYAVFGLAVFVGLLLGILTVLA